MNKAKIRVLIINPMERPKVCYIEPTMRAFRYIVNAEAIKHRDIRAKKLENGIYAIFGKDNILSKSPPNRHIGNDIISGTILIVASENGRAPVSLTDDKVSKYCLRFWSIETFDEVNISKNTRSSRLRKAE